MLIESVKLISLSLPNYLHHNRSIFLLVLLHGFPNIFQECLSYKFMFAYIIMGFLCLADDTQDGTVQPQLDGTVQPHLDGTV